MVTRKNDKDITVVISGEAGQGIQTLEKLLLKVMKSAGFHVFAYSEFMSRIRGGNNSSEIRISTERVQAFVDRIDIFIPISAGAMRRFSGRIGPGTLIVAQDEHVEDRYRNGGFRLSRVPFSEEAEAVGGKAAINVIILGMLSALMGVDRSLPEEIAAARFAHLSDEKKQNLADSIAAGYRLHADYLAPETPAPPFALPGKDRGDPVLYGSEAIGIGAFAGGCNFVAGYPMSPSTSVLEFMARHARDFEIVFEQVEDEICAINMALGAWYAGGRAMVTTSGGGFSLMTEGLSLAGCIESPLVINLGQRPGPATGLPTKTEQADLLMALHAGHGEFPRVIFAPGDTQDGIALTCRAFNLADRYQVPVFILTDQYFLDSACDVWDLDVGILKEEKHIVETTPDYRRYRLTESGVSPRGIPGYGGGIVCADSDEHDEYGVITEDPGTRVDMVNKRLCKLTAMEKDTLPPRFIGASSYEYLVVGWGSTLNALVEAVASLGRDDLALLHFSQVYPLHASALPLLEKAKIAMVVEGNATAQFAALVRQETGFTFGHEILKYDGMPFSVEELAGWISDIIPEKS